ncbi:hypothetical protein PG991_012155 [Apiospora marii]|uniref:Uncharacterized protein n=1 Tax=Apiospora marii TaxID=335849 RepID=A0ABR1RAV0_9PEZI
MTSHPVIQSPNPTRSRLCLVLATVVYTSLLVAWCCRDDAFVPFLGLTTIKFYLDWYLEQPYGIEGHLYGFFWAVIVNVCASVVLLGVHSRMRFEDQPGKWEICCPDPDHRRRGGYNDKRFGKFYRASCLCAGVMSVCAMALYCLLRSQQGATQYFFACQGLVAFWTGYWLEWWTTILGNRLAAYGC